MQSKSEIIAKFKQSENDTGSVQVQVALLTERINHLTEHLKTNHNDNHSRRGLLKMVGKRKGFLQYLKDRDIEAYTVGFQPWGQEAVRPPSVPWIPHGISECHHIHRRHDRTVRGQWLWRHLHRRLHRHQQALRRAGGGRHLLRLLHGHLHRSELRRRTD